jgi:hypothetical protein
LHQAHCNTANCQTIYEAAISGNSGYYNKKFIPLNKYKAITPQSLPILVRTAEIVKNYAEFDAVARPLIDNALHVFSSQNRPLNSITIQDVINLNPGYDFSALNSVQNPAAFTNYTNNLIKSAAAEFKN